MNLKYNRESLELVGHQLDSSGQTDPELPTSVAEWYSRANGLKLLEKYSNEDVPLPPSEFESSWHENKELIVFLYENQGVFWWAFEKGDHDDPAVYVNEDPPSHHWVLCSGKFSDFVYTRLFDFYHWHDDNLLTLAAGKPLENDILNLLKSEYSSHPITLSGHSKIQYRFSNGDQKITIHDNGSSTGWYLSADSPAGVRNLLVKFEGVLEGHFPEINGG